MEDSKQPKNKKRKLIKTINLQKSEESDTGTKIKIKKETETLSQKEHLQEKTNESDASDDSELSEETEKQTRGIRKKRNLNKPNTSTQLKGKFTDYEKIDLFNGLIQHGSSDISVLQSLLPNKNTEHVKQFLFSTKRTARYALSDGKDKAPIDKWLEFLIADPEKDRKINDLSRTLKYIALFEPCVEKSESFLSECYKLLSDCMKGESPKHLDPVTSLFLHEELQKLIRVHKSQNYETEQKYLENYKKKTVCYSGKKKTHDSCDPRISNPLKIPDSLLELKK